MTRCQHVHLPSSNPSLKTTCEGMQRSVTSVLRSTAVNCYDRAGTCNLRLACFGFHPLTPTPIRVLIHLETDFIAQRTTFNIIFTVSELSCFPLLCDSSQLVTTFCCLKTPHLIPWRNNCRATEDFLECVGATYKIETGWVAFSAEIISPKLLAATPRCVLFSDFNGNYYLIIIGTP